MPSYPSFAKVFEGDATPTGVSVGDRWITSSGVLRTAYSVQGSTIGWFRHFGSEANAAMTSGVMLSATLNLTNAQIKAIRATPITIVAAPGAGKVVLPIAASIHLVYGGTNAFTGAANDNFGLKWKDGTIATLMSGGVQGFVQATATSVSVFVPAVAAGASVNITKANADNQPLVVHNITAAEIAGNAAGDNTMIVNLQYVLLSVTW